MEFELLYDLILESSSDEDKKPAHEVFKAPTPDLEWLATLFNELPAPDQWYFGPTKGHPLSDYFDALVREPPQPLPAFALFHPDVLEAFFKKVKPPRQREHQDELEFLREGHEFSVAKLRADFY